MTRIKKIKALIEKGEVIKYHYNEYRYQRRLIIDTINEFNYKKTSEEQLMAGQMIDLMYWEYNAD